nr:unnamed protein product [Digitaria exilis]
MRPGNGQMHGGSSGPSRECTCGQRFSEHLHAVPWSTVVPSGQSAGRPGTITAQAQGTDPLRLSPPRARPFSI